MRSSLDPAVSVSGKRELDPAHYERIRFEWKDVAEYRAILEKQAGFESVEVMSLAAARNVLKSVQSQTKPWTIHRVISAVRLVRHLGMADARPSGIGGGQR